MDIKEKFVRENLGKKVSSKGVNWTIVGYTLIGEEFIILTSNSKNRRIGWSYDENPLREQFLEEGIDTLLIDTPKDQLFTYMTKGQVKKGLKN